MDKHSEQETIAKVQAGNMDAYAYLVEWYSPRIRSFIASRVMASSQVDDLAQEVFIIAWKRIQTYRPEASFWSWLAGIAHNLILNHWRRCKTQQNRVDQLRANVSEEVFNSFEEQSNFFEDEKVIKHLHECVDKLPEMTKRVVKSRYFEGKKLKEIGPTIGMTMGAVSKMLVRTREALRQCIDSEVNYVS